MTGENLRLNPFVYIPETDVRFYLLVCVGIIVPTLWAVIVGMVLIAVEAQLEMSILLRLLITLVVIFFIPLLILWLYTRAPQKIIRTSEMEELDSTKFQDETTCLKTLQKKYLPETRLTWMYQPKTLSVSAFTFGTKNNYYINLSRGMLKKFQNDVHSFTSVIRHEFGHIANRDVEKAYLANSTWRSLLITLSVPFAIFLLYNVYLVLSALYYGFMLGYSPGYILSGMPLGKELLLYGGILVYFLIFLGIIYVLRNQIIRLREFYADQRALDRTGSLTEMVTALEKERGSPHSPFELLAKFHPDINERIQVIKNNEQLFVPSLWVAFTAGFFYGIIELTTPMFSQLVFSISPSQLEAMKFGAVSFTPDLEVGLRAAISLLLVTVLMLAVSSGFHKSILRDLILKKTPYFSAATFIAAVTFSLAFSLGYLTDTLISLPSVASLYDPGVLVDNLLATGQSLILLALYFFITLVFLLIFASMLIRRSYSGTEAMRNFFVVSVVSSFLFIINRYYAVETLHNKYLVIVFFLIFSGAMLVFIKVKDRSLHCPHCGKNLTDSNELELTCQNCRNDLYAWALYPSS